MNKLLFQTANTIKTTNQFPQLVYRIYFAFHNRTLPRDLEYYIGYAQKKAAILEIIAAFVKKLFQVVSCVCIPIQRQQVPRTGSYRLAPKSINIMYPSLH
jgi:hypothetical protein